MAGVQDEVLSRFLERVSESPVVSDAVVIGLRELLADGKVPKPNALVQLVVDGSGDSLT
jgi:hypothetical protein